MRPESDVLSRRKFLADAVAASGATVLTGSLPAMAQDKR